MSEITDNPFLTQADYKKALEALMAPLKPKILATDKPGLYLGSSGAVYDQKHAEMEALVRPLWGLAPYWQLEPEDVLKQSYLTKIAQGTDPTDPNYWGDVTDYDQYIVEMAALALTLLLDKESIWKGLSPSEQQNLVAWLKQALGRKIPKNNWTFFKVLIRVALFHCGEPLNRKELSAELALIDTMYIGSGWYVDGKATQKDYYIPFAFHYYGLIFAKFMKEAEPEWSAMFSQRATEFAQDFIYYFDEDGEALPYGRSGTYRFAQGAFFSALIFAEVEAIPWGQMKTLLSRHLKNWLGQAIFTVDGRLSIGYHYENLVMAEGYNAPGSPYWAMKFFLLLATKADHPFWQAEPLPITRTAKRVVEKGNMFLVSAKNGNHLLGYPAGLMIEGQAHGAAKYSKFVYSSKFGYSVPKAGVSYEEGAFDNVLALSLDGCYFRPKAATESYQIRENCIFHQWRPFEEVQVTTEIYPFGEWHVRVHEIETAHPLELREGGFSLPLLGRKAVGVVGTQFAKGEAENLCSQIVGIEGYDEAQIIQPEVNTSVFFPRTSLPYLKKKLVPGKHRLISLVGGIVEKEERK